MSAAKRARTTRSSSSRSATSSFTLQGDESATCAVPEADARKSPTLRALLDEARGRAPCLRRSRRSSPRLPPGYDGAADLSADQARPAAPDARDPPDPRAGRAAAICRKIRTATTASSIKELQEQEYARLIDSANAADLRIDADGKVNVWNQCAIRMTGYTGEDVSKHLVNEFITDDYKSSVQDAMKKAPRATTANFEAAFDNAPGGAETANFEFLVTKAGARVEVLSTRRPPRRARRRHRRRRHRPDITARSTRSEYARLIDTANAPIFGVDVNGKVNVWNQCAIRMTGYTGEDVMGKHVNENAFDSALEGVETANFEFPLITKQGTHRGPPQRDDAAATKGRQIGAAGIGQDITARIAQEQEYARLIDTANAPIFGIDVNGHHLVNEFITADYKESVQEVFMKALDGVETANFGFPLQTKQGTRVQILLNATTPRRAGRGHRRRRHRPDITARIAQEQEYARLIDTANAPIFGVDANGNVNVWNRCASNLTGFGGQDVMGKHLVNEFITPEYKAPGTRIEVLLNATTRRDEKGRQIGVVGIGQDITARIAQE
ncbi:hypothetical protein JL721_5157 [Aureococcus anophagefferens]|nr:hypothetical protein JL721_5157 [Aureococcus anophagefferens]